MIDGLASVAMETPAATAHYSLALSSTSPALYLSLLLSRFIHPSFINLSFSQTHKGQPPRHVTVTASPIILHLFHIHSVPRTCVMILESERERETEDEKGLETEMPFKRK